MTLAPRWDANLGTCTRVVTGVVYTFVYTVAEGEGNGNAIVKAVNVDITFGEYSVGSPSAFLEVVVRTVWVKVCIILVDIVAVSL